jgi:hypothetical protein
LGKIITDFLIHRWNIIGHCFTYMYIFLNDCYLIVYKLVKFMYFSIQNLSNLCSSYDDEIWTTWLCIGGLCYDDLFFTLGSFSTTICHNTILLSRSSGVDWVNVTWVFFTTKVSLVKQLHLVNFVLLISYKPPCFVSCVLFFQLLLGLFW